MAACATNCTENTATTSTYDYDDTSTMPTPRVVHTPGVYYIYGTYVKPAFDDVFFDFLMFRKEIARKEGVYWHNLYVEHFYRLRIALIFNIYAALYSRRMMFPKSGFLARIGRRRRN
jgi:hypothetical protein